MWRRFTRVGEKAAVVVEAQRSKSPIIFPALMLAQNTGMRSSEIRTMQWKNVDLQKRFLVVATSKTAAGEGRTIPLNSVLYGALSKHANWFELRFGRIEPNWYLFPFGKSKHFSIAAGYNTEKSLEIR
jgi:integrase